MGPDLLLAAVGPLIGGVVSVVLWIGNRNAKAIDNGFTKLQTTIERVDVRINEVDDKIEGLKVNVAENYVTNSRFQDHLDLQASMQARLADEIQLQREDQKERSKEHREHSQQLRNDISEIKEMQWKTRMGLLDIIDRRMGSPRVYESDIWDDVKKDNNK